MSALIGALRVTLGLDSAAFEKGAGRSRRELTNLEKSMAGLKRVGSAVAGALAATGITAIADAYREAGKAALDAAGGIGESAARLGVSTTALQQFRFAATQVGLSTEEMDGALGQFSKRLGAAELAGKGPFVTALRQIGLTLDDLKGKTDIQQISVIADGIDKAGTVAQQSALQVQFFGKAGQGMSALLREGSAGIKAYADEAQRLGVVLSEGDIAKADETADKLAKLQYVLQAQQNKKLLENSSAIVAYEQAIGGLKLAAINSIGGLEQANQRYNAWALKFNANLRTAINGVVDYFAALPGRIVGSLQRLFAGVDTWLRVKLGATLDWVGKKAKWVGDKFFELYDRVVGHSYVPDMVDGIAAEMARLDGIMVDPAAKATAATADGFRAMAGAVQGILDRLFPQLAEARRYAADVATVTAGIRDPAARDTALRGLRREAFGLPTEGSAQSDLSFDPAATEPLGVLGDNLGRLMEKIAGLGDRARATTVAVAKSFADMANNVLQSIGNLSNSFRSGNFLDILQGVIGLGLQLGGAGLFGKTIANRINAPKIPGNANGTANWRGGLTWVGERGPELVNLPRGSQVYPNGMGPLGGGKLQVEVVANNNGFGAIVRNHAGQVVAESAPALIEGGARVAQRRIGYASTRRVA